MNPQDKHETAQREALTPERFYDRSRASAFDLLKHLVTLSTAGVAAFFVTVSTTATPPLTGDERHTLTVALCLFVLAVFSGIAGWGADAWFYQCWARHLEGQRDAARAKVLRNWAHGIRKVCIWCLGLLFLLGIIASAIYLGLRLQQ
jgi:hypothetical protein